MAMRRLYWSVFSVPACFLARYSWARICGGRGKRGVRGSRGSAERTEKPVERTREAISRGISPRPRWRSRSSCQPCTCPRSASRPPSRGVKYCMVARLAGSAERTRVEKWTSAELIRPSSSPYGNLLDDVNCDADARENVDFSTVVVGGQSVAREACEASGVLPSDAPPWGTQARRSTSRRRSAPARSCSTRVRPPSWCSTNSRASCWHRTA